MLLESLVDLKPKKLLSMHLGLQKLIEKNLWLKILFSAVFGIGVGILFSREANLVSEKIATITVTWLAFPGQLFLGLIQMIVLPLVFASVIGGIASSENIEQLKKLGIRISIYFVTTTTVAISMGLIIAHLINPGQYIDKEKLKSQPTVTQIQTENSHTKEKSMPQLIAGLLPDNPLASMVAGEMFQVVLFALILGIAIMNLQSQQAQPLLNLLGSLQEVCMIVVSWAMRLAPIAVFGLLAQVVATIGFDALLGMGAYVITVLLGLVSVFVFYLVLARVVGGQKISVFLREIRQIQLLAFSTSSSASVMPLSVKTAEEGLNVRPSIARFIVPLGATINMDGTALYQGVATVFLAQIFGVDLSLGALALVVATAVGASIGSPGTPGVGIVILASVLHSVGIPIHGVALIIGVDRILDMSRTVINVTGDLTACVVMNRLLRTEEPVPDKST